MKQVKTTTILINTTTHRAKKTAANLFIIRQLYRQEAVIARTAE